MTIKLSDYIKNPKEVFTLEEAEEIYRQAGYIDSFKKEETQEKMLIIKRNNYRKGDF